MPSLIVLLCAERLIASLKQFRLLSQTRNLFVMRAHIQRSVCVCARVHVHECISLHIWRNVLDRRLCARFLGLMVAANFVHRALFAAIGYSFWLFAGTDETLKRQPTMANVKRYALCRQPPQQPWQPWQPCPAQHSNRAPSSSQSFWRMYCCSSKRF